MVNFHKSKVGELGIDKGELDRYSKILNCRIINVPFIYLGIIVGKNPTKQIFW